MNKWARYITLFMILTVKTGMAQDDSTLPPCTGTQGLIVNFDKVSNVIVETPCDSLKFIAEYIQSKSEEPFAVIGISTVKSDKARKEAEKRAKRTREELIALGVDKKRLKIYVSYFKAPADGEHTDWPFYPPHYTYEIGVYIQSDL